MPQPQPLTFEQFARRGSDNLPRYNNIILYFRDSDLGGIMREQPDFKRFQAEHQDLEERLREAIGAINIQSPQISEDLKPHEQDLYAFYLIMAGYGVPSNSLIGDA